MLPFITSTVVRVTRRELNNEMVMALVMITVVVSTHMVMMSMTS